MSITTSKPCHLYTHLSDVKEVLFRSSDKAESQILKLTSAVRSKPARSLISDLAETLQAMSEQIRLIGSPLPSSLLNGKLERQDDTTAQSSGRCAGWDIQRRYIHSLKNYLYGLAGDLKAAKDAPPVNQAVVIERLNRDVARYYASLQGDLNRQGYARIDARAFMKAIINDLRPSLEAENYLITDHNFPPFLVSASESDLRDIFESTFTFVTNVMNKALVREKRLDISLSIDGPRRFAVAFSYSGPAPTQKRVASIVAGTDHAVFNDPLSVEYHFGVSRMSWRTKSCNGSFEIRRLNRSQSQVTLKLPRRIPYRISPRDMRWLTS